MMSGTRKHLWRLHYTPVVSENITGWQIPLQQYAENVSCSAIVISTNCQHLYGLDCVLMHAFIHCQAIAEEAQIMMT
jgi:hypothetical protein